MVSSQFWRRVNELTLQVNLDERRPLNIPEADIDAVAHGQTGWVTIERRGDDLYLDGRKIVFLRVGDGRNNRSQPVDEVLERVRDYKTLHPNILDAWQENPDFLPETWGRRADRKDSNLFFLAATYLVRHNNRHVVRYMGSHDEGWLVGTARVMNESLAADHLILVLEE